MLRLEKIRGRAWVFGDDFDVDFQIVPYRIIRELPRDKRTEEEMGKYAFTLVDPDFPKKVKKGDIVVAGTNFGCGHDHPTGPQAIKGSGIVAVIAESMTSAFYRNSLHIGLPVIQYEDIREKISQGNDIEIDYKGGTIKNHTTGETLKYEPVPDFMIEILEAGGLYPQLKQQIDAGKDITKFK